jgi:thioesterase domain-containing protein
VLLKAGSGKPPLFIIHDGDGETLLYRTLANRLDPAVPVYGIQPYRREGHPILHTRITDMARYYVEQIRQIQPQGPYFISGLCSGGIISFEVALQLQLQGQQVGMVAILDAADVETPMRAGYISGKRKDSFSQLLRQKQDLKALQRGLYILNGVRKKVTNLITYEAQKRYKEINSSMQLNLYSYFLDKQLPMPKFLENIPVRPVLGWAQQRYAPNGLFNGEVLLFRATKKSNIFDGTAIDDTPFIERFNDPLLGWGKRVTQGVQVQETPGGHSSMLQEPNVQVIADKMQAYMDAVLSNVPNGEANVTTKRAA